MNIPDFIQSRMDQAFDELAEALGDELAAKHGQDMPSGSIALEVTKAQMYMRQAWQEYCKKKGMEA